MDYTQKYINRLKKLAGLSHDSSLPIFQDMSAKYLLGEEEEVHKKPQPSKKEVKSDEKEKELYVNSIKRKLAKLKNVFTNNSDSLTSPALEINNNPIQIRNGRFVQDARKYDYNLLSKGIANIEGDLVFYDELENVKKLNNSFWIKIENYVVDTAYDKMRSHYTVNEMDNLLIKKKNLIPIELSMLSLNVPSMVFCDISILNFYDFNKEKCGGYTLSVLFYKNHGYDNVARDRSITIIEKATLRGFYKKLTSLLSYNNRLLTFEQLNVLLNEIKNSIELIENKK